MSELHSLVATCELCRRAGPYQSNSLAGAMCCSMCRCRRRRSRLAGTDSLSSNAAVRSMQPNSQGAVRLRQEGRHRGRRRRRPCRPPRCSAAAAARQRRPPIARLSARPCGPSCGTLLADRRTHRQSDGRAKACERANATAGPPLSAPTRPTLTTQFGPQVGHSLRQHIVFITVDNISICREIIR